MRAAGYGFTAVLLGALLVVALTGTLSTDAVDNGPATTLEQAMLAADDAAPRVYGIVVRRAGPGRAAQRGAGPAALAAGGGRRRAAQPRGRRRGAVAAQAVPAGGAPARLAVRRRRRRRRADHHRLPGLYLAQRYGVSMAQLGWLFFATAGIQAVSVTIAPRLARRFGLVATMVGTHLPSNVLLAAVAFAPTFGVAVALLPARTCLSQMDVPTGQAPVMTVVTPDERTMAAAVTNAARYTVRPIGPLVAGAVQQLALGAPLLLAGIVKGGYDLTLWRWARRTGIEPRPAPATVAGNPEGTAAQEGAP